MTDQAIFEERLRRMLSDVERSAQPPAGFEERLLSAPADRPRPHRVTVLRTTRWLPPVLAAAAVAAVIVVGSVIAWSTQSHRREIPAPPFPSTVVPTPTPAPTSTATGSPTSSPSVTRVAQAPVPTGFTGFDVSFIDADRGWALGNYDCSTGRCATVLKTVDGGAHWSRIAAPSGITPVDDEGRQSGGSCGMNGPVYGPCVNHLVFADDSVGYAWSSRSVFVTTNGGQTWQAQSGGATDLQVAGGNVLRVRQLQDGSSGFGAAQVEVAPLGSSDWQRVSLGAPITSASTLHVARSKPGLVYLQAMRDASNANISTWSPTLYRSEDGGHTWTVVGTDPCGDPNDPPFATMQVSVAPDGPVALVCETRSAESADPVVTVQIVTNDGHTIGDPHPVPAAPNSPVRVLTAMSADHFVYLAQSVSGTATTVLSSVDGGASWQSVDSAGVLQPVTVLSATTAYRVRSDRTGVVWTTDGGRTWRSRYFR